MARRRNIFIRDFFHFDMEKNKSTCKTCGLRFQGSRISNLKRHVVSKHFELHKEEYEKLENELIENICDKKKNIFSVKLSAPEVINACVELVTKELQCFNIFDCNAFKILTDQIFQGLNIPAINSSNIMNYVSDKYDTLKCTIKRACKGRMISLKMDTATRHDRTILGINIQIIKNHKIHIYTLAMKELTERHTAANLKKELEKILEEFEIKKNQIYTITTDNGRNMIKAIKLFSSDINEVEENGEFLTFEMDKYEQCVEILTKNICCEQQNVVPVKCAAHMLQLAVKDFFSDNNIEIIEHARQIIKTLRTPIFRYSLQHLNLKKLRIDVPTQWNSTFDMLQRLLKYKDFCNENFKNPLTFLEEEWILIEDIVETLLPLNEATLNLQRTQMLFGDFYKLWLNLKLHLKIMDTNTAGIVLHCLEKRETQLLKNKAVNAAFFLDPRLKRLLSSEQKTETVRYLKKIAVQMISLKQGEGANNEINMDATCTDSIAIPSTSSTSLSLLRESIREMEVDSSDDESKDNSHQLQLVYNEIKNYKEEHIDINTELMIYWKEKKYAIPHVAELATIVHAVPATQVSVERAFSALKLMLDNRRCKLSAQNLQKLMFVKLNAEFTY